MAWIIGGNSQYFNQSQMENNAKEVWYYYSAYGWTLNAVSGMLGNMQRESTLNPALIEIGGTGRGLVQWTPPTDLYKVLQVLYGSSSDWSNPEKQCRVIYAEFEQSTGLKDWGIEPQWYKTATWQYSWNEWAQSTDSPADLASAFMAEYERPGVLAENERRQNALNWYTYLGGIPPKPESKASMPLWLYPKFF